MRKVCVLFIILSALASAATPSTGQPVTSSPLLEWNPQQMLILYLNSINMIHPGLAVDYSLNNKEDEQRILDDIAMNAAIVRKLNLAKVMPPDELLRDFEVYALPQVFDLRKRYEFRPLICSIFYQ